MNIRSNRLAMTLAALLLAWPAVAAAQMAPDVGAPAQMQGPMPAMPMAPAGQMGMMPMMPMMPMPQMMPMMGMMGGNMMGHGGPGMQGMGPGFADWPEAMRLDHIEGRIAFVHAELKITDAQSEAWNAFASVLRENAARQIAARDPAGAGKSPSSLDSRLGDLEARLTARLANIRALRPALGGLMGVLAEDQRALAEDLLTGHMGVMPGASAMGMNRM